MRDKNNYIILQILYPQQPPKIFTSSNLNPLFFFHSSIYPFFFHTPKLSAKSEVITKDFCEVRGIQQGFSEGIHSSFRLYNYSEEVLYSMLPTFQHSIHPIFRSSILPLPFSTSHLEYTVRCTSEIYLFMCYKCYAVLPLSINLTQLII